MDDVVGIKVRDAKRGWVGFMTWGRLWDPVDDTELLKAVRAHLHTFGIEQPEELELCSSLRELRTADFFYEAIINFSWRPSPFGDDDDAWKNARRAELEEGRSIYFLGDLSDAPE
jgi:hypothetical protein